MRDRGIEPVINGVTPADRHTACHHVDARATALTRFAKRIHIGFKRRNHAGIRGKKRIFVNRVPAFKRDFDFAQLREMAAYHHPKFFIEPLSRHRARRNARRGQARGRTPTTAMVANAELLQIGVIGVARTEAPGNIAVILAALIFVADQQRNRRAGGLTLEYA